MDLKKQEKSQRSKLTYQPKKIRKRRANKAQSQEKEENNKDQNGNNLETPKQ